MQHRLWLRQVLRKVQIRGALGGIEKDLRDELRRLRRGGQSILFGMRDREGLRVLQRRHERRVCDPVQFESSRELVVRRRRLHDVAGDAGARHEARAHADTPDLMRDPGSPSSPSAEPAGEDASEQRRRRLRRRCRDARRRSPTGDVAPSRPNRNQEGAQFTSCQTALFQGDQDGGTPTEGTSRRRAERERLEASQATEAEPQAGENAGVEEIQRKVNPRGNDTSHERDHIVSP